MSSFGISCMSIALDIGTSRLRSIRREGVELIGRSMPAAFSLVDDDPTSRALLAKAELPFAAGEGQLALVGDSALDHAAAFQTLPLPLLPGGMVPVDDPPARQLLGSIIESLLPEAVQILSPCAVLLPVASMNDESSTDFVTRLVGLRGYRPLLVTPTHALALATLSTEGFTGVCMTIGAGGCSMSLVHCGRELAAVQDERGTHDIDSRIATAERRFIHGAKGERYLDTESARRQREALSDGLARPATAFGSQVAALYRELLQAITGDFAARLREVRVGRFETPLPVVCAGGGTRAAGFPAMLSSVIASSEMPLRLAPARVAPFDEYLFARGALIHAELESVSAIAA